MDPWVGKIKFNLVLASCIPNLFKTFNKVQMQELCAGPQPRELDGREVRAMVHLRLQTGLLVRSQASPPHFPRPYKEDIQ